MKRFFKIVKVFFRLKKEEIIDFFKNVDYLDNLKFVLESLVKGLIILSGTIMAFFIIILGFSGLGYLINMIFNFIPNVNFMDNSNFLFIIGIISIIVLFIIFIVIRFGGKWIRSNIRKAIRIVEGGEV